MVATYVGHIIGAVSKSREEVCDEGESKDPVVSSGSRRLASHELNNVVQHCGRCSGCVDILACQPKTRV